MRAVVFERFGSVPEVREVPYPEPPAGAVVVAVEATGVCRSDWHGLAGHDPDIVLPHVPGHEFAGVVHSLGAGVTGIAVGERVSAPFVYACGRCEPCRRGDQQVCLDQRQPGFTRWGSFAEYVVVERAAVNLVRLPGQVGFGTAAVLGCRFGTAFRAVTTVGAVRAGEWVAVHGCGGVGLSAVMIAVAAGARVVAVDVSPGALDLARELGAEVVINAHETGTDGAAVEHSPLVTAVREVTGGGAHLSLDALGSPATCAASIAGLRTRGRHVQVGLLPPALGLPPVPMHLVVGRELQVLGSHGLPAHAYPQLLSLVASGRMRPDQLITGIIGLDQAGAVLAAMGGTPPTGITVVYPGRTLDDSGTPGL
jgi:D-arabinose 1-dehydrogenase-like Zn-dependent alcohol dehydrogenase